MPTMPCEGQVDDVDRRVVGRRHPVQPDHLRLGAPVRQQGQAVGDLEGVAQLPVDGDPAEVQGHSVSGAEHALHGSELGGLVVRDEVRRPVADDDLHRGQHTGEQ